MEHLLSFTEENYLKAILHLTVLENDRGEVGTNELAAQLGVKPATVNDMLKKLREKEFVQYEKYGKTKLTVEGRRLGMDILRKHRLWETFLYSKLGFKWDEVHEVAEQLEHIHSGKLIDRLDLFLEHPKFDPHGDPIPNAAGEIEFLERMTLNELEAGSSCLIAAVKDNSAEFLQYVDRLGLSIGSKIILDSKEEYDNLLHISIEGKSQTISQKFAENLYVIKK